MALFIFANVHAAEGGSACSKSYSSGFHEEQANNKLFVVIIVDDTLVLRKDALSLIPFLKLHGLQRFFLGIQKVSTIYFDSLLIYFLYTFQKVLDFVNKK